jgi:hypothetical protein
MPAPPAVATEVRPLEGTVWTGTMFGREQTFEFRPAGVMRYAAGAQTYDNGRWVQNGAQVAIDTNDHYADYSGTIEGDTMSGTARNKRGLTWVWSLARRP